MQDSLGWLNSGYVDCLIPMNYTADLEMFNKRASGFVQKRERGLIYMGLEAKRGEKAIRAEIAISRKMNFHGLAFFAYGRLFPGHKPSSMATMLKREYFQTPSRVTGRRYED